MKSHIRVYSMIQGLCRIAPLQGHHGPYPITNMCSLRWLQVAWTRKPSTTPTHLNVSRALLLNVPHSHTHNTAILHLCPSSSDSSCLQKDTVDQARIASHNHSRRLPDAPMADKAAELHCGGNRRHRCQFESITLARQPTACMDARL